MILIVATGWKTKARPCNLEKFAASDALPTNPDDLLVAISPEHDGNSVKDRIAAIIFDLNCPLDRVGRPIEIRWFYPPHDVKRGNPHLLSFPIVSLGVFRNRLEHGVGIDIIPIL